MCWTIRTFFRWILIWWNKKKMVTAGDFFRMTCNLWQIAIQCIVRHILNVNHFRLRILARENIKLLPKTYVFSHIQNPIIVFISEKKLFLVIRRRIQSFDGWRSMLVRDLCHTRTPTTALCVKSHVVCISLQKLLGIMTERERQRNRKKLVCVKRKCRSVMLV